MVVINITNLLTQTAQLSIATGLDDYGQPIYQNKTINCIKSQKYKTIVTDTGISVANIATVITDEPINSRDKIDGGIVGTVINITDAKGDVIAFKAVLI